MFRSSIRRPRRGAILLIVLAMLVLMAVLGLTFVLRSQSAATTSRIAREKENKGTETQRPNGDEDAAYAMSSLIFGAADYNGPQPPSADMIRATQSGFRGHELARAMYGYDRTLVIDNLGNALPGANLSLYSGLGRFTSADGNVQVGTSTFPFTFPLSDVLNYAVQPGVGYVIDPERNTARAALNSYFAGTYKSVAAPYTYPDTKDFYLAVVDPTTGRVLQPSFYRNWTFNTGTPNADLRLAPPSAVPTNTDWQSAAGRLRIVRPRPEDHIWNGTTTFPYPVQNPDGSYTGDVQNLKSPLGQQRMDSIWIYPGGPIKTWNGKQYTTLVAPLILDLNGRVNLSIAGNNKAAAGGGHASASGMGPHEINPARIFELNTNAWSNPTGALRDLIGSGAAYQFQSSNGPISVASRYNSAVAPPADRLTALTSFPFNGGAAATNVPPIYSRVDVDGAPLGTRVNPIGSATSPFPAFDPARYYADAATQATELTSHPSQFGQEYWGPTTAAAGGRTFEPKDMRFLATRYGAPVDYYTRAEIAKLLPRHLGSANYDPALGAYTPGTIPGSNPAFNVNDRANLIRQLVTTDSSHIWRPEVLIVNTTTAVATANGGGVRLGPIDLNRPLTDYRVNPAQNYGPDNVATGTAQLNAAQKERQALARDIYVRLVAVSGLFSGGTQYVNNAAQPDFMYPRVTAANLSQLRVLAQLAVNIVDYVDKDDVATTFTFNLSQGVTLDTTTGFPNSATITTGATSNLGDAVVFGTEPTRIALNEIHAEVGNALVDYNPAKNVMSPPSVMGMTPATQNFRKRFWIELYNPLQIDTNLSESGLARLHYPAGSFSGAVYSPYMVAVTNYVAGAIDNVANTTGSPRHSTTTLTMQMLVDKYEYDATDFPEDMSQGLPVTYPVTVPPATFASASQGAERYVIHPSNDGTPTNARNLGGFCVLGPRGNFPDQTTNGMAGTPAATIRIQAGTPYSDTTPINTLELDVGSRDETMSAVWGAPTSVYLRRLANPYLPPNDPLEPAPGFNAMLPINPYITVDRAENITPKNNVRFGMTNAVAPAPVLGAMAATGRPHPYAGAFAARADQTSAPTAIKHTFFGRNDNAQAAFTWLTHLDRSLVNTAEIISATASSPHSMTEFFCQAGVGYNRHTAERILFPGLTNGRDPNVWVPGTTDGQFHSVLDLLAVRPHATGIPVGGRQKGIVNANTMWHKNVLNATLDANAGNYFTDANVDVIWAQMNQNGAVNARTQNGASTYDVSLTDKPFRGFTGSLGDPNNTVLRRHDGAAPPLFYTPAGSLATLSDQTHAYAVTEPLRKMWNSTATVSNNFLVIMTVGFFEVRQVDANGRVYLGQELYDQAPGDLREKYTAIIDRTGVALENGNVTQQATQKPWFTALAADVSPSTTAPYTINVNATASGQVYLDGVLTTPMAGQQLWLGFGSATMNGGDGEQVTVTGVTPISAGVIQLTLSTSVQRYHAAGSPLSNVLLGNPGPQLGFDPSLPQYRGVVPYFTKLPPGE